MRKVAPVPTQGTSPQSPKKANQAAVAPFPGSATSFPVFRNLIATIRASWPQKTAAHVAHITGTSERAVKFWLAGSTRMSVDAIGALLRTDEGYDILAAIMGDCDAEWWLTVRNSYDVRQIRKQIAREQRRLDRIRERQRQIDLFDDK